MDLLYLRLTQGLIALLGGILVYYGFSASHKKQNSSLLQMAAGFLLVTVGAVAGGVLFEVFGADIITALLVQDVCQALGFLTIIYSLASRTKKIV
jgi:hypothetical protein